MKETKIPEGFYAEKLDKRDDWRGVKCIYCGKPATNSDHVPPENLFATVEVSHPYLTGPSCSCNNQFSGDDDQFRNIVVDYCKEKSSIAKELSEGKVKRSESRNPKLAKQSVSRTVTVERYSNSGLYLGTYEDPLSFSQDEIACIHRMADRIARLMHWKIKKSVAPLQSRVKFVEGNKMKGDKVYKQLLEGLFMNGPWTSGHPDVFKMYAMPIGNSKHLWAFYVILFDSFPIHFFFGPQEDYFIDSESGILHSARG